MAEGKWITGLTADTPLGDAARRVLAVRLGVVGDCLPLALYQAGKDPEYVHQLRVGTRRAGAALAIFGDCLPWNPYRKVRKMLRRIRRAAGAARDWDVFIASVAARQTQRPSREQPGLDYLLGYALSQRIAAQARLEEASPPAAVDFDRSLTDTLAAARWPSTLLLDLARPQLSDLLRELHQAALHDLGDYAHLHQVRIVGKRLRYAMEIFADCFGVEFRERIYPAVEEMQEILGHANDSHVAAERLTALRRHLQMFQPAEWKRIRPGVEGLLRYHQQRLPRQRKQFLKWLERWEKAGAEALLGLLK
jgi:CHAD domain-containing protein